MVSLSIENGKITFGSGELNILVSFYGEKKVEAIVDGGEVGKLDITLDYDNFLVSAVVFKEIDGKFELEAVNVLDLLEYFKIYNPQLMMYDLVQNVKNVDSAVLSVNDNISSIHTHIDGNYSNISSVLNEMSSKVNSIDGYINSALPSYLNVPLDVINASVDEIKNNVIGIGMTIDDNVVNKLDQLNYNVDLSPVTEKLNEIDSKLDSVDCDIDLSSVTSKLDDICSKVDVLNVFDISNKIDEKLSQLFSMNSLNGSNGSKFKDGSNVTVKGYDGNWVVEGSYPMLNGDNVTIIVYKLTQDDKVLLAPAPYVEKV